MGAFEHDSPEATDDDLVNQLKEVPEDWRSFEALVSRHQAKVLANCRYLTRAPQHAEDLAQEVFMKAYFGLPGFEGRAAFTTWLHRLKVNHCLNFLARRQRGTFVDVEDPVLEREPALQSPPAAEARLERQEQQLRIDAVLDGMSDTLRVPLVMRDMDGLGYQEIADILGLGLSAVKMRIKRAREEFQERYRAVPADGLD